jgi:hypothetical protein
MNKQHRQKLLHISYPLCIFLGSFLLFQIQPIISKYILPWFGGSSAVWTAALVFFQVLLLLGYSYTLVVTKHTTKRQSTIHFLLLTGIACIFLFLFFHWPAPIFPPSTFRSENTISPLLSIILILSMSIGLPYFLLSTTSTLLQKWFHKLSPKTSPYPLYALSNSGSLLAIVTYPFFIEPYLNLHQQAVFWGIGFLIYCSIFLLNTLLYRIDMNKPMTPHNNTTVTQAFIEVTTMYSRKRITLWILLSALSTLMLIAITNVLTLSVAPVPFLWLLPLATYLLTYIICFSGKNWYKRNAFAYCFLLLVSFGYIASLTTIPHLFISVCLYTVLLFSCCMLCHGELYARKPLPQYLDMFYLFTAVGGAIGGIFVAVIAPLIFSSVWEFTIGMVACTFLAVIVLVHYQHSLFLRFFKKFSFDNKDIYIFVSTSILILLFMLVFGVSRDIHIKKNVRNFYGMITVAEAKTPQGTIRYLTHGKIVHGSQILTKPHIPTTYYVPQSGVGHALQYYPRKLSHNHKTLQVGLVGLGVGTLAAYGKSGDTFRFFEINPIVASIAQTDFMYLKNSKAKTSIVLGDGRLQMEKEIGQLPRYDIIVLDAFSDDAIPAHLLTKEAFAIYLARLAQPNGLLAIHITNTYLDLIPVLLPMAKAYALHTVVVDTKLDSGESSKWMLFSNNKKVLSQLSIPAKQVVNTHLTKNIPLWTDDYSNLFQILK